MERAGFKAKQVDKARSHTAEGFTWTRRFIAISATLAIVVLPLLFGALFPGMPITFGWQETTNGFLFFTDPNEVMRWSVSHGLTILPLHTHIMSAVLGMYFGSSTVK